MAGNIAYRGMTVWLAFTALVRLEFADRRPLLAAE